MIKCFIKLIGFYIISVQFNTNLLQSNIKINPFCITLNQIDIKYAHFIVKMNRIDIT
jgi:hypothetical protein